jgi:hypothetical protein
MSTQFFLDVVLYSVIGFSVLHFGAAFVTGWLRHYRAIASTVQAEQDALDTPDQEEAQPEPMLDEWEAAIASSLTLDIDEAEPQPKATDEARLEMKHSQYHAMSAPQLRKACQGHGIQWRDAHGRHKHLKKAEMVEALSQR